MTHIPLTEARAFTGLGEICTAIVRNNRYDYAELRIEANEGLRHLWIAGRYRAWGVTDSGDEDEIVAESWIELYAKVTEHLAKKGINFT